MKAKQPNHPVSDGDGIKAGNGRRTCRNKKNAYQQAPAVVVVVLIAAAAAMKSTVNPKQRLTTFCAVEESGRVR